MAIEINTVLLDKPAVIEPFDPSVPEVRIDPYPIYHRYRAADPVHWGLSGLAGYAGAWYLFRCSDVVSVLKDPRFGKARRQVRYSDTPDGEQPAGPPPVPDVARPFLELARKWIVHRDPPDHTRLRQVLKPAFLPLAVEKLRPRIVELAHELVDRIEEKGSAELISDFAFPLPVNVICEMLGVPEEGRPLLSSCSKALQAVDLQTPEETWRRAGDAAIQARQYIADLVAERRRQPREDLITRIVELYDGGADLSEDEMLANILFLFVAGAGFETTTGLLGSGILALLQHPDQRRRLLDEPGLVGSAVDEFLRFESPVQMTNRTAVEDVELDGRTIRAGDSVLAVLAAANRDPAVFPDPDRLDIGRSASQHHAFGVGIHYCLGGPLARIEGEVAFDVLFRRLPGLQLSGPFQWTDIAALRVLKSLPATF